MGTFKFIMVEVCLELLSTISGIFLVLSSIQGLAKSSRIFLLLFVMQVVEQGHEGVGDTEVETEVRLYQISFKSSGKHYLPKEISFTFL